MKMLKDRTELENFLIKTVIANVSKKNIISASQKWCMQLFDDYGIPISMSADILSQRKDLSEYNEFILFAITDVIKKEKIKEYFTTQEIKLFSGQKFMVSNIQFPLKFHLIKITDEQYIGKTTAQFLMQLREKQLINYNAETQRALRIMLKGGTKIMRPYINNKAVGEIAELYGDGNFIPNMITLNINADDENADYKYDDNKEILTIKDITAFDIADGYHRYLGMGRNYDIDHTFDYPMMLQISTFSVGKAKQMIWQENHQTKMRITDSKSYNQYDAGNMVVNRLNTDTDCNLCGKIQLNNGLINPGDIAQIIDRLYFPKKPERKDIIIKTKEIREKLNKFTEESNEYLDKTWEKYEIYFIIYGLYNDYGIDRINEAIDNISSDHKSIIQKSKTITNRVLDTLKEVY